MVKRESSQPEDNETRHVPDVSVIIVNWNLRDFLRRCLESIHSQGGNLTVETIVVDNASSDGSTGMMEQEFPDVLRIINEENAGFARACNQGLREAGSRYLFLLNNDAELLEGVLASLVGFMDAHPDIGVCGPRVVNGDGTLQVHSKGFYPSIPRIAGQLFLPGYSRHPGGRSLGLYEFNDDMKIREFDWLSGCALLARREAVEDVGLLDAEVFMYCEDMDWCYRMKQAGWKVMYLPLAQVLHYGGQSMLRQRGAIVGSHAAGLVAYYSRYHGRAAALLFRMVLAAGYAVQAVGWVIGGLFGRRSGLDKLKRISSRRWTDSGK
ncbi:MAG: glycosyltransferase family 2 protein [Thermoleophilia bacterium]|nr:glycosyltransferase family 2 protein [Thermoleophilia bacterium]